MYCTKGKHPKKHVRFANNWQSPAEKQKKESEDEKSEKNPYWLRASLTNAQRKAIKKYCKTFDLLINQRQALPACH